MIDNETQSGIHWRFFLAQTSQISTSSICGFGLRRTAGEIHIGLTCEISLFKDFNSFKMESMYIF